VVAEQIAPYLDDIGEGYAREYEGLHAASAKPFNGQPVVSPEGQIVYHFPSCRLQHPSGILRGATVPAGAKERFSAASSGQILLSAGLGVLNFVGALVLGNLLADTPSWVDLSPLCKEFTGCYYGTFWACR